jgi:outer membrane lipoprotein-sorting protein
MSSISRALRIPVLVCAFLPVAALAQEMAPPPAQFRDEPGAHALYDLMVKVMRNVETLSWVADYRWGSDAHGEIAHCTYEIWLKKPNHVRIEASREGELRGILVGDGEHFWIHWPPGRPRYGWERSGERAEAYEKTRLTSYLKIRSPTGAHSIGHQTGKLGAGMSMTVLDPSTFHGSTDSLQQHMDGVCGRGAERVGEEICDVVEVRFMKGQRSWRLWLSRRDGLPRRLVETVRVRNVITKQEVWTDIRVNHEIPDELFAWQPPEGWVEFRKPPLGEGLLKVGVEAPDFDLPLHDGGRFRLSEHRGKIVWFYLWRAG